jgi:DUF2075 family protein
MVVDVGAIVSWVIVGGIVVYVLLSMAATKTANALLKSKEAKQEKELLMQKRAFEEELQAKRLNIELELQEREDKIEENEDSLAYKESAFYFMTECVMEEAPWLAGMVADVRYYLDRKNVKYLREKKRPAPTAAENLKQMAKEKRDITAELKLLEYQLNLYEGLFPWLEDYKEITGADIAEIKTRDYDEDDNNEYEQLKYWLSPEEYDGLSTAQKYQLALDRYKRSPNKSNWRIGIEYERFIGYLYEIQGYDVKYLGATEGKEDMGRDLICQSDSETYIVQCKRWSAEKTIHEKHIFQLYGSAVTYKIKHDVLDNSVYAVFVTTTRLSDLARQCAHVLGVLVEEQHEYEDYPCIKCNISKTTGEKIYHLPFDQQYDKVMINHNRGELYAWNVEEAETKGFRRAFRWRPDPE